MIRSTKYILKFQTKSKTNVLDKLFVDFRKDLDYYIDLIIAGKLPLFQVCWFKSDQWNYKSFAMKASCL